MLGLENPGKLVVHSYGTTHSLTTSTKSLLVPGFGITFWIFFRQHTFDYVIYYFMIILIQFLENLHLPYSHPTNNVTSHFVPQTTEPHALIAWILGGTSFTYLTLAIRQPQPPVFDWWIILISLSYLILSYLFVLGYPP